MVKKIFKRWKHRQKNWIWKKKKLSSDEELVIINEIKKDKTLSLNELKHNIQIYNINISKSTLNTALHKNNFIYGKPSIKPILTENQKIKRLEWAHKYLNLDWQKVIYSDESTICKGLNGRYRWIDKNINDVELTTKHPLKRHCWGCINFNFSDIFIFDGIMDADMYLSILNNNLLKHYEDSLFFQHDNDPKHTAKKVVNWLTNLEIQFIDWPSNSPDLNPIENIWNIHKQKISKIKTKTTEEFETCIKNSWNSIDMSIIKSVINSMPHRLEELIKNNGDYINY